MNTKALGVLVITPIRASVASRVYFATLARERAREKGLSAADWSLQRLLAPTTLTADIRMTFDVGGEVVAS